MTTRTTRRRRRARRACTKGCARRRRETTRFGGLASLYRSLPTTLAMNVPYGCASVALNEHLKSSLKRRREGRPLGVAPLLACGGAAGGCPSRPLVQSASPGSDEDARAHGLQSDAAGLDVLHVQAPRGEVVTLDLSRYGDNHKLSLSQVAEKFGVSRSFVYTIIKEFELETSMVGNQRRVDLTAFSNALRNHNEGKRAA